MSSSASTQQDQNAQVEAAFRNVHQNAPAGTFNGVMLSWTQRAAGLGTFTTLIDFSHQNASRRARTFPEGAQFRWPVLTRPGPDDLYTIRRMDTSIPDDAVPRPAFRYAPRLATTGPAFTLDLAEQVLLATAARHLPSGPALQAQVHVEFTVPGTNRQPGRITTLTEDPLGRARLSTRPISAAGPWDTLESCWIAAPYTQLLATVRSGQFNTGPNAEQETLFDDLHRMLSEMHPRLNARRVRVDLTYQYGSRVTWEDGTCTHRAWTNRNTVRKSILRRHHEALVPPERVDEHPHLSAEGTPGSVLLARLTSARLNVAMHPELCLLIARLATAWQSGTLDALTWTDKDAQRSLGFFPLGTGRVLVRHQRLPDPPATGTPAEQNVHVTIVTLADLSRTLMRVNQGYLQDTLAS